MTVTTDTRGSLVTLHRRFLSILPRIERHGRIYFRHVKCADRKAELLAELRGLCWKWFVRLVRRGKDVLAFVSSLATYAARAVSSGRRVCGHEKARDVLSPVAQRRHGFSVGKLPDYSTLNGNPLEEALAENTVSPVPEQVAFRVDFPAWILQQLDRDRRLVQALMVGERTKAAARTFGLSQGRVSQKRREFQESWRRYTADPAEEARRSAVVA